MTASLEKILGKPSDYFVCDICKNINFYENEECHNCYHPHNREGLTKEELQHIEDNVVNWVNSELEYWLFEEGYNESETFRIEYDI